MLNEKKLNDLTKTRVAVSQFLSTVGVRFFMRGGTTGYLITRYAIHGLRYSDSA